MKNFCFLVTFSLVISFQNAIGQQLEYVDFIQADAEVSLFPEQQKITGVVTYQFEILESTKKIFLDAKNMKVDLVSTSSKLKLETTDNKVFIRSNFKKGKRYNVSLSFEAQPQQALYFFGIDSDNPQIWTQGQGKYTSHWLPSIDDMNDKIIFNLSVEAPAEFDVLANGKQTDSAEIISTEAGKRKKQNFQMQQPMSSYLLALAVGKFHSKEIESSSGVPIQLYINESDSLHLEPTFRHSKELFDFLENEIDVAYPWQNYKQVSVRDFLYAGMENTSLTLFSDQFITDSIGFEDKNYVTVNAHELAHQWFGNLVTETESKHHWLHEGFATYYALLAEREIFGEDYFYYKLYESAEQLKELSDQGKGEKLLSEGASSLTYYQKGAWALHILREKVGAENFRKGVKNYVLNNQFKNVTTEDFLVEMRKVSDVDLEEFETDWLHQVAFQADQALASLKKSLFMKDFLQLIAFREVPVSEKKDELSKALDFPVNDYMAQEAVYQLAGEDFEITKKLYQKAFRSKHHLARQAIATSMAKIPPELQADYESLLADDSYLTQEKALFNLWMNFPEKRVSYLQETNGIEGFQDKNIKTLWLMLALATPDFEPEKTQQYFHQLANYTAADYSFYIRKNAFNYLYQLDRFTVASYQNLLDACMHPNWRFRKFCNELLEELLRAETHRNNYLYLEPDLPERQRELLEKKLANQN
ncbi:MAG: M1 family metallopeptidase [Bacteroidota bacterium]